MFLGIILFVIIFILIWTFITQIAIPFKRGTSWFPFLREENDLESRIALAKQGQLEKSLKKELDRTTVKCCGNCLHVLGKICKNKKAPLYKRKVEKLNWCDNHAGRNY